MNPIRLTAATALLALTAAAFAQTPDTGRGNTAPGMSRDGSAPGAGAITGGSIAPGERGGTPSGRDTNTTGREDSLKRCNDLQGVLREQCLRNAESAGGGSTGAPAKAPMGGSDIEPRLSPPPQNPR